MKKTILFLALIALVSNGIYAQSSDQNISAVTPEQNRFEATIICLDAVEAPTKYNAFAKEFINDSSFPKKGNNTSQDNYKKEINSWFITNPTMVEKVLVKRKKSHDILYGPRPY